MAVVSSLAGSPAAAGGLWLDGCEIERIPARARGSYVLLIRLDESRTMAAGALPGTRFRRGYYAYVGSAMRGIKSRIGRHLKPDRKRHWHIDYLLEVAEVIGAGIVASAARSECAVAGEMALRFDFIPGFGSSDCRCRSHLFYAPDAARLRDGIKTALAAVEA
ncbi:MAG: DUF123 domain-containing protein [Chloroflexota bacterium]